MTEHRVRSLHVHLRTHGAPPDDLKTDARSFAEALLAAVAEKLEARSNGKHLIVRRLPVRLRAHRELLRDRAELERIADEIARSISWREAAASWDDDVAVFADEVDWRAMHLVEYARGQPAAWCFSDLAAHADGIAGLSGLSPVAVEAVLARVAQHEQLDALLERLTPSAVVALAAALGVAPVDAPARETAAAAQPHVTAASAGAARLSIAAAVRRTPSSATHPGVVAKPAPNADTDMATAPATGHITRFGGLAYVVSCLLELDAGETLWRACVPEQSVIAAALAALVDTTDDAALLLLGGAEPARTFEATADQRGEIVSVLCASLHAALPRRGLARVPDVVLALDDGPHGRMLYALVASLPIFGAPAPSIEQATAAVDAFLRAWPRGTVAAAPEIVEIARDARIEVRTDGLRPRLSLRRDLSRDAALVTAITAGCAAALYQSRVGELDLECRARIHDADEDRIVTMPMDAIRVDVRRAGLDRDPGWVPWLQRIVRIAFEE